MTSRRPDPLPVEGSPAAGAGAVLGIDLGDRRIGLALSRAASGDVSPLRTLARGDATRDAATLRRICEEHGVSEVVVGLPLLPSGDEGEQASRTREWVAAVAPLLGRPIALRDERRTSLAAEERIGPPPRGRAGGPPSSASLRAWRARLDREAAATILQAELDARAGVGA